MSINFPDTELLTADEEVRLAKAIEAGVLAAAALAADDRPCASSEAELAEVVAAGKAAHQRFYLANTGMVVKIARQWAGRADLPLEELIQEGCVGLGEAIQRWDHTRGIKFSSFAYPVIQGAVLNAATVRCGEIHTSRFQARYAIEVRRAQQRLEAELGRRVNATELAQHLGRDEGTVARRLNLGRPDTLSDTMVNMIGQEEADYSAVEESLGASLPQWLEQLPQDERLVLEQRFGLAGPAVSRASLAVELGVSTSTVRRIENRALGRARRFLAAV